jgi:hypothetical protein
VSIPPETITLSKAVGQDLQEFKRSHLSTINLYYSNLESKIDRFIDEVYGPFIIQFVLEREFESYENNKPSIISDLRQASRTGASQEDTDKALQAMVDFQRYATQQIAEKRTELIQPIREEQLKILKAINASYDHAIAANSTLTGYLASVKDVKEAQTESLALIGIDRAEVDQSMLRVSDILDQVITKGKAIDTQAEDARNRINALIEEIKRITNR